MTRAIPRATLPNRFSTLAIVLLALVLGGSQGRPAWGNSAAAPSGALALGVHEAGSGEPVAGAIVLVDGEVRGETDGAGAVALDGLRPGQHQIDVLSASHAAASRSEVVQAGERRALRVELAPGRIETVVVENKAPRERPAVAEVALSRAEVTQVAGSMGDPLRVVENLPGLARAPGGLGGALIVRGANPADTAVYIDGVEVPMLYHFGGLTSVVSGDLVGTLTFSPGGFGAEYGRATAGLVRVETRPLDCDRLRVVASVDLLDAEGYACAPVQGWRVAAAARRSYVDTFLPALMRGMAREGESPTVVTPVYFDYQTKLERVFAKQRFEVLAIGARDSLALSRAASEEDVDTSFGGSIASHRLQFRHKYFWSERTTLESAIVPGYLVQDLGEGSRELGTRQKASATMATLGLRQTLSLGIAKSVTWRSGFDHRLLRWTADFVSGLPTLGHRFPAPGGIDPTVQNPFRSSGLDLDQGYFTELALVPHERLTLIPGLRLSHLDFDATERWVLEPRFAARFELGEGSIMKSTAGVYRKLPDLFSGVMVEGFGQPALSAERAASVTLGFEHDLGPLSVGVEGFDVRRDRLPSPTDAVTRRGDQVVPALFDSSGKGHSAGAEVLIKRDARPERRFSGWVAYTLSRSTRTDRAPSGTRFEGNDPATPRLSTLPSEPQTQLSRFDQTHILTTVAQVALPWKLTLGLRFQLVTGTPISPQDRGRIVYDADGDEHRVVPGSVAPNSDRLPTFHKVDLRLDKRWTFKTWSLTAYLDVLNAYNRRPVEALGYDYRFKTRTQLLGLPVLPMLGVKGEI